MLPKPSLTLKIGICLSLLCSCAPRLAVGQPTPSVALSDPGQRLRVVVMGDQGTGDAVQHAVARAMAQVCGQRGCDLGVGVGDNFYPRSPDTATSPLFRQRFEQLYGPLGIPFLMVGGNHDQSLIWGGDGGQPAALQAELDYATRNPVWKMPGRLYSAQAGSLAHFFALDTSPLAAYLPSLQKDYAQQQQQWLQTALKTSGAHWKILIGHHPLWNNGKHGEAGQFDGLALPAQRGDTLRSLYLAQCDGAADVLLSGHDHSLQLFAPQPECPQLWTLISGAAGEIGPAQKGQRPAQFQAFGQPGFAWLEITPREIQVLFFTVLQRAGKEQGTTSQYTVQLAYQGTITKNAEAK